jgi:ketosteroid isomerase-like protein
VLLAFFPLAFTSTCTDELCGFTDDFDQFAGRDVDALMSDYCESAVLLTPDGTMRGIEDIRAFFEAFMVGFSFGSIFEASQQVAVRNIGYVVWTVRTEDLDIPFATDTMIFSGPKILTQTFTAQMNLR